MTKYLHPNYLKSSRLIFLSGGIYIIQEIFSKDILSVESNYGLVVILTGLLTFGLGWLVKLGHGWIKYVFLACIVLSLFMPVPVSEQTKQSMVELILLAVVSLFQLWAVVLLFMIPRRDKIVVE